MVRHIIPKDLSEALKHLDENTFRVIAGGTDLMIQKRSWAETPPAFDQDMLYILNLPELNHVNHTSDGLIIGAMTPLEDLLDHPDVPKLLKEVMLEMAGPGLRYVATLAGNIGNASPAGDSLVPLYLMDARIVLESLAGQRTLPIEAVITGPRQTVIRPNELIRDIVIPHQQFTHTRFIKVGTRKADAIAKVSFAGAALIEQGVTQDFRIALGAVYQTVIRDRDIEDTVVGKTLSWLKTHKQDLLDAYEPLIQPIDDQRSNKIYRKHVALRMIGDFIDRLE
ncbi:MAG: xanthine dehydrogenase family protein subunit M [Acholeplasmataceae bacterium]|nr:MAG: xanthine dehydrogenase family protein subunit M [Acholeplasmataceae bacterium]